jgi:enterobactin synthetase component D
MRAGIELPAALERATSKRRIQFLAGQYCARASIEALTGSGAAEAPQRDADGCPVWPRGLVGSISHTTGFATAAVASTREARGLGVDAEPVMSGEAAAEVARLVALDDETRLVRLAAGITAVEALTLVFSAKESLFKALYPPTRRHFDYLDCEIVRLDPEARRFAVRLRMPLDAVFGGSNFGGRYELIGGEVRTGVLLPWPRARGLMGLILGAL